MRVGHLGLIFVVGLLAAFAAAELFDELDGDSSGSLDHEEYEHFLEVRCWFVVDVERAAPCVVWWVPPGKDR